MLGIVALCAMYVNVPTDPLAGASSTAGTNVGFQYACWPVDVVGTNRDQYCHY